MHIGKIVLEGRLILAPMAGVTDLAFREVCRAHGAALSVTEMVSTKAMLFQDKKTRRLLALAPNEHPSVVQIFGHEPQTMAEGAKKVVEVSQCDIVDINMGCPAPKIVNNGDGSALMKDPQTAAQIIEAVKRAVDTPVSVKFRLGWDEASKNYLDFARMAEQSGADMICVHGRTRSQQYSGQADWDAIAQIKQQVRIPVVANGDVFTAQDAVRMLAHTGADGAMIGRGSLGNPWIFAQANALLNGQQMPSLPTFAQRMQTALQQIERAAEQKGEHIAMLEARKHVNWYLKGVLHAKPFKTQVTQLSTLQQLYTLVAQMQLAEQAAGGA